MSGTSTRPMRADARRSREAIVAAASELFAARGSDVQMNEIADRAELGMGTLYRHFATKQALLAAIVSRRFTTMIEMARTSADIAEPGAALDALLIGYLEIAEQDAAFRYAILGPEQTAWSELAEQKAEFSKIARQILSQAVEAGILRRDITFNDFVLITRGAMANMNPADDDWRRYLQLVLEGARS